MKKAFTLIEMIVVIIIISILFLIVLRMGWNYVRDMQFRNDKEEFLSQYNKLLSQSMSSNYYEWEEYKEFSLQIADQWDEINLYAITWNNQVLIWRRALGVSYFSWLNNVWTFLFQAYELGCWYEDWDWELTGGNVNFQLISIYDWWYCFDVNLDSCKISESKCLTGN